MHDMLGPCRLVESVNAFVDAMRSEEFKNGNFQGTLKRFCLDAWSRVVKIAYSYVHGSV